MRQTNRAGTGSSSMTVHGSSMGMVSCSARGNQGTHGMRGDAMAVGDICAVSCGARGKSDTSGGDDCRAAGRKREQRVVGGHRRAECDAASQPSRDGVGVDDGTRIEHGVGCTYSSGQGGADGMQGDGVAVRDVCAVSCGTRGKRDTSGGDDGRAERGTCKPRVVGGHRRTECDAANEPSWDRDRRR
jgi:hypothetical protein